MNLWVGKFKIYSTSCFHYEIDMYLRKYIEVFDEVRPRSVKLNANRVKGTELWSEV